MILSETERAFRVTRYEQLKGQLPSVQEAIAETAETRSNREELMEFIDGFRSTGDIEVLRQSLDSWSRGKRSWGFSWPQWRNDVQSARQRR